MASGLNRVRKVAIVGGTHGNESCGPYLVEILKRNVPEMRRDSISDVICVTGNPQATERRVRFIDEDLNRSFSLPKLADPERSTYEAQRAKALNAMLGPKPGSGVRFGDGEFRKAAAPEGGDEPDSPLDDGSADFVIDLHSTTSNMGCTLIVPGKDKLSLCASAYAAAHLRKEFEGVPIEILYEGYTRAEQPYVTSIGKHGIMVECGPVPWGVVRHDVVAWMRSSVKHVLDYLHAINDGRPLTDVPTPDGPTLPPKVPVVAMLGVKIPVPADAKGKPLAMFHPKLQDNDWCTMETGDPMFIHVDGSIITYDGAHGDKVVPHFCNEAAYYLPQSGLGFALGKRDEIDTK